MLDSKVVEIEENIRWVDKFIDLFLLLVFERIM